MTIVDPAARMPAPLDWVRATESRAEQSTVDGRRVLLAILLFIPMALGALVAIVINCAVYAWAAGSEGYRMYRPANTEDAEESARWEAGKRT